MVLTFGEHARALLYNGLGRYEAALTAAESASAQDELPFADWSLPELVEAAIRSGKTSFAAAALERLTERTQAAGTDWALGIEARSRALLGGDRVPEELYLEAIERLGPLSHRTGTRPAHISLYGEWLRRAAGASMRESNCGRRTSMFAAIGMEAFAERARGELLAQERRCAGARDETRDELTAQERQIARLRATAIESGDRSRLFLSSRTVEWHPSEHTNTVPSKEDHMAVMTERSAGATTIRPFTVEIPEADLDDLKTRIEATRWPEKETVDDQSQGVPLATMQALARYWENEYDWRKVEARLNAVPQFMTDIDGLDIHFIHVRSKHEDALPLIVTHGWPGSVIEQLKIIGRSPIPPRTAGARRTPSTW